MRKLRLKKLIPLLCIIMLFAMLHYFAMITTKTFAMVGNRILMENQKLTNVLIEGKNVKSSEYLYNLDGSADFIYVEFEDSGYAVYSNPDLSILEYSLSGTLPYSSQAKKYYTGPTGYFNKVGNKFENLMTGESTAVANAGVFAQQIRKVLNQARTENGQPRQENYIAPNFINDEMSASLEWNISKHSDNNAVTTQSESSSNSSNSGGIQIPAGGIGPGATYIKNADYFLTGPYHGFNMSGTCGAVASQLILSYNNYYNDRRIIDDVYLFNGNDGPNTCADPMRMTPKTLGTRGEFEDGTLDEDGSDAINSYFYKVVEKIPASSGSSAQAAGIRSLLNERKNELNLSSNLATVSQGSDIDTIKNEIDAGRPIIISMHYDDFGNHAIVGYGYQTLRGTGTDQDGQLGFITHYGWAGTSDWTYKTNIWVNAVWCYSWVKMEVTHTTHRYGVISGSYYERICQDCGHRISDYPFTTNVDNGQVEITGISATLPSNFTIPSVINGNQVRSIAANAFYGNSGLTDVKVPYSIQSIGAGAFSGCSNLTSITLPFTGASRSSTGNDSYLGYIFGTTNYTGGVAINQNGTTYYIPASLKTVNLTDSSNIKAYSFENFNNLTSINLPYGTSSIGANAFSNCSSLYSFEIPRTVTNIGANAFSGCSLYSITIPYSVSSIGANAFRSGLNITWYYNPSYTAATLGLINGLRNVIIESGTQSVGPNAFNNCSNLRSVTIGKNVSAIAANAFSGCTSLSSVKWYYNSNYTAAELGGDLSSILTEVEVSQGVDNIKANAFNNCTNLKKVTIGANVKNIGVDAFLGCTSLTSMTWNYNPTQTATGLGIQNLLTTVNVVEDKKGNTITKVGDSAFAGCTKLNSVWLYNTITSIGENAFDGCVALPSIIIPDNVTIIGANAFANCSNLKSIRIPIGTATIAADAFVGSDELVIYAETAS